jgi:hypothetical protein
VIPRPGDDMGCCGVCPGERTAMLKGFLCSIAIALSPLIAAAGGDEIIVETSHATIEPQEGQRLRVVFAAEDRPAMIFKPVAGAWNWSQTSRLVIPIENPGDEALTLLLRVEDHTSRSLTGKVAIAPRTAGHLAISIGAPSPRSMGMIAGPSRHLRASIQVHCRSRRPTAQSMPRRLRWSALGFRVHRAGAHWFQYIDEPLTGRTLDGENAHIGFVTVADLPYVELVAAARGANLWVLRKLHRIASRGASE